MVDKEISELTDGGAVQSGDRVHVVRGPNSRGATLGGAAGLSVGTTSGTVAAGDDARIVGAIQTAGRAATSVIGRSAGTTGDASDIAATSDDTFLRRVGGVLEFGALTIGMIADGLVTYAKIASAAIASVADLRAGTASKLVDAAGAKGSVAWVAGPADASTMTFNHDNGWQFYVTTTTARTITASNLKDGHPFSIEFTGEHLHSYDTDAFDFTPVEGVPTEVWAKYEVSGIVRSGKVSVRSVVEVA